MNKKITIIIKDISEGKQKGFTALMPELNNSIAFGDTVKELLDGVLLTIEGAEEDGIGIFKKARNKYRIKKFHLPKTKLAAK